MFESRSRWAAVHEGLAGLVVEGLVDVFEQVDDRTPMGRGVAHASRNRREGDSGVSSAHAPRRSETLACFSLCSKL